MPTKPRGTEYLIQHEGRRFGPYTRAEIEAGARSGKITGRDLIYDVAVRQWVPASRIPGLVGPRGKRIRAPGAPKWILVLAFLMALGGVVGFLLIRATFRTSGKVVDLGVVAAPDPDRDGVIRTDAWGHVPPGRLNVRLAAGAPRTIAEQAAEAVGGTLVGEMPFIDLYQIDLSSSTEAELRRAIDVARSLEGVRGAFPDHVAVLHVEGTPCSPLADPVYEDGRARPHEMTGVQGAWDLLRAANLDLHPIAVGIVDTGLYTHRTAVTSVIADDADDGGVVGIAAPLADKLTITVATGSFLISNLASIQRQVEIGAQVLNLSWGTEPGAVIHPLVHEAYEDCFAKMAEHHPTVVFVCSAGNEGTTPDDGTVVPAGFDLPNVITVGNLNDDGGIDGTKTNVVAAGKRFRIDIAAPGDGILRGVGPEGEVVATQGGTSMAAPQVVAAIALLKSLDPDLTCSTVKQILTRTARKKIERADAAPVAVPQEVGGRCLAIDRAVLEVINRRREQAGIPERRTMDDLLGLTRIALGATQDPDGDWVVTASVPHVADASTTLTIRTDRAAGIGGYSTVTVEPGRTVRWVVSPDGPTRVYVTRNDTGACWSVPIGSAAPE